MSDIQVYVQNATSLPHYKNVSQYFVALIKSAFVHNFEYSCFELECFIASGSLLNHKYQ